MGIRRSLVNSPHKGQWRGALMFSFICAWTNGWVNNRVAGDLRRHLTHYCVTVMWHFCFSVYWMLSVLLLLGILNHAFNSSPSGQNGHHFADDDFKCILVKEKFCTWTTISLKFVPKGTIDNIPAFVKVMAWCRTGNKPLSEQTLPPFTDTNLFD